MSNKTSQNHARSALVFILIMLPLIASEDSLGKSSFTFEQFSGMPASCLSSPKNVTIPKPVIGSPDISCARLCVSQRDPYCVGFFQSDSVNKEQCITCPETNNNSFVAQEPPTAFYWLSYETETDISTQHITNTVALYIGQTIRILGVPTTSTPSEDGFNIDLQEFKADNFYIALRLGVRYAGMYQYERFYFLRSKIPGETNGTEIWTNWELYHEYFPFEIGQMFQLLIFVNQDYFTIYLNNHFLSNFTYTLDFKTDFVIDGITIENNVRLLGVMFT